ncbi:MAG TPA: TIGR00282 family metallophosphoesterase [Micropepsaceae bacterium]|nr:TIGR00282 family metallophosphoesterase [Micropepsaceae bacterium]HRK70493.1 TIGR00282 family metallophosphoesterase [Micropepsaceae bacterium]
MRLLFLGDVVGQSGRDAVVAELPRLRKALAIDFAVVNGENAAHGFGITERICAQLIDAGADVITTGNHVWDQREALSFIEREPRLLRPLNYPKGAPGKGVGLFKAKNGGDVLVINAMGRVFMDQLDCPFAAVDAELNAAGLGRAADAIIVDMHADATSEKMAMGHWCDGRASLCVGTHSHVPTADAQILPKGTAYQTDAGACADYDSVIGMVKDEPIRRFLTKLPGGRMEPANGPATVCGVFVETDEKTGLAVRVEPVRVGGRLKATVPQV